MIPLYDGLVEKGRLTGEREGEEMVLLQNELANR
jgi:hypothetical protein